MPFEAYKHRALKRTYFIPRRNPVQVIDDDRDYTVGQAANLLGVDRLTIDDLVKTGRLETTGDGKIAGDALAGLAGELEPIMLDLIELGTTDEDEEKPAALKTNATKRVKAAAEAEAEPVKTRAQTKRLAVAEEEDTSEDEPETWSAECPSCGEQFDVAGDVLKLRCPGCGEALTVSQSEDEPKATNLRHKRRFLGIL